MTHSNLSLLSFSMEYINNITVYSPNPELATRSISTVLSAIGLAFVFSFSVTFVTLEHLQTNTVIDN